MVCLDGVQACLPIKIRRKLDIEFQNINTAEDSGNRAGQLSLRIEF